MSVILQHSNKYFGKNCQIGIKFLILKQKPIQQNNQDTVERFINMNRKQNIERISKSTLDNSNFISKNDAHQKQLFELRRGSFGLYPTTQRKNQQFEKTETTFMDNITTPLKNENKIQTQSKNTHVHTSDTSKYREVLIRLDQTEQKLVISQKKYGQLWRKYEGSCETVQYLNRQLSRKQQTPQSSDYDSKKKLSQLQKQISQKLHQLSLKNAEIDTLRHDLTLTKSKLQSAEQKVQQTQRSVQKLYQQKLQKIQLLQKLDDVLMNSKQQKSKSYERIIYTLREEIDSLHNQLSRKSEQFISMQKRLQSPVVSQSSNIQTSTLHAQFGRLHKEKLSLVQLYEQKISHLQQNHEFSIQRLSLTKKQELQRQLQKLVAIKIQKQELEGQRTVQMGKMREITDALINQNKQLQGRIANLQIGKNLLQNQLNLLLAQSNSSSQKAQSSMSALKDTQQLKQLFHELQYIKRQFSLLKSQMEAKQKQFLDQKTKSDKLIKEIKRFQQELKIRDAQDFQYGSKMKKSNKTLLDKLASLQQENQLIQRELLAQRLESAKLAQQLEQKQQLLKRQYDLSLQNVKCELSKKIKQVKEQKKQETVEKQKTYFQLRQIERKYELLVSQMLTVDDMMSIATKVHKRHSTYVKKIAK